MLFCLRSFPHSLSPLILCHLVTTVSQPVNFLLGLIIFILNLHVISHHSVLSALISTFFAALHWLCLILCQNCIISACKFVTYCLLTNLILAFSLSALLTLTLFVILSHIDSHSLQIFYVHLLSHMISIHFHFISASYKHSLSSHDVSSLHFLHSYITYTFILFHLILSHLFFLPLYYSVCLSFFVLLMLIVYYYPHYLSLLVFYLIILSSHVVSTISSLHSLRPFISHIYSISSHLFLSFLLSYSVFISCYLVLSHLISASLSSLNPCISI